MTQRYIIFVPGKNPKPRPAQHKSLLWRTLLEGVRRAEPLVAKDLIDYEDNFKLIAWNYLYYHSYKDSNREVPWIDALINQHGPTEQDIKDSNTWHRRRDRMLYNAVDFVPAVLRLLPGPARSTAQELNRYFTNGDNIASTIREQLKHLLRPMLTNNDKVLLIGHSLGSVIAYDTLWELSREEELADKVDLFLTIGSPLGMNYVQHRLRGNEDDDERKYPANIKRWVNISSNGDITALDRQFTDDFADMLELGLVDSIEDHCEGIYNFYRNEQGLNCHRSYGYMVNPAVGSVIAEWWRNNRSDKLVSG